MLRAPDVLSSCVNNNFDRGAYVRVFRNAKYVCVHISYGLEIFWNVEVYE